MNKLDAMIRWYDENDTRREYTLVKAKLKMIQSLLENIRYSDDRLFIDEIIGTFSTILELHQSVIADKETEAMTAYASAGNGVACDFAAYCQHHDGFHDDKQVQAAFAAYLSDQKGKALSSYTINDYCSRIRNLWEPFYAAYLEGFPEGDLHVNQEQIRPGCPLVNAFYNVNHLQYYATVMSVKSDQKKNWSNTLAALNKFAKFVAECQ